MKLDALMALPGIALTILCWGAYGPVLHRGQMAMSTPGNSERLKPLICVGLAYFLIAIVIPMAILIASGRMSGGWSVRGVTWSLGSGAAGAVGALGIIWAMSRGGTSDFVMPLVFGGAPIVNVLVGMYFRGQSIKEMGAGFPFFLAGVIMVAVGAFIILSFAPKGHGPAKPTTSATSPAAKPN